MFETLPHVIASGYLVRADGWGPENDAVAATWPKWKLRASRFFNVWSCGALFGLLNLFYFTPQIALACALAFVVYRIKGFRKGGLPEALLLRIPGLLGRVIRRMVEDTNAWQDRSNMFIRGLWSSAIGFLIIALVANASLWCVLLSIPFAYLYKGIYAGGYKYLPQFVFGLDRHVWIEHASGWILSIFSRGIVIVALAT